MRAGEFETNMWSGWTRGCGTLARSALVKEYCRSSPVVIDTPAHTVANQSKSDRISRKPCLGAAIRPRLNEWVADFALAGQAALEGPDLASRMVMFRVHYLGLAPYENAGHFLGLRERSWVNWSEEIRRRCGKELLRRSVFPPREYFASGD